MNECNHKSGPHIYAVRNPATCAQCQRLIASGIADRLKSGDAVVGRILASK